MNLLTKKRKKGSYIPSLNTYLECQLDVLHLAYFQVEQSESLMKKQI